MNIEIYDLGYCKDDELTRVVCVSKYKDKYVFSFNKNRNGWEIPGGHIENEETWEDAAKREMYEETGATKVKLYPVCVYKIDSFGLLCYCEIQEMDDLPEEYEMSKIMLSDYLPNNLTFPESSKLFFDIVSSKKWKKSLKKDSYVGKTIKLQIDRPFGSRHSVYDFIYPVNCGYVANTVADNGEELDAYLLGVFEPVLEYVGKCIAIIHRTNDNEDKLVIVPEGKNYSDDAINALTEFQEQYYEHTIIRK